MISEYVHLELGQEVNALAGYYIPLSETRLKHDGKEFLCVLGTSTVDNSCCGSINNCAYAIVPGYVLAWQNKRNEAGLLVTEVEPIIDEDTKREISKTVREIENVGLIDFW
ncbi:hypothetical protein ACFLVI_01945 [Chloroflexota bacterium]